MTSAEKTDNPPLPQATGSVDWSAPVPQLKGSYPLVVYFATAYERDEFIRMVRQVQPGMVSVPLPNAEVS